MKKIFNNRKAQSFDNLYTIMGFVGLILTFSIVMYLWAAFSNVNELFTTPETIAVRTNGQNFVNTFDFILLCAYIGVNLSVILISYLYSNNPILYATALIISLSTIILSAMFSNTLMELFNTGGVFVNQAASLPITLFIITWLPYFQTIFGFLTMVVLFGFGRSGGRDI